MTVSAQRYRAMHCRRPAPPGKQTDGPYAAPTSYDSPVMEEKEHGNHGEGHLPNLMLLVVGYMYNKESNVFITQSFFTKYSHKTLHSSPVRVSYGVSYGVSL